MDTLTLSAASMATLKGGQPVTIQINPPAIVVTPTPPVTQPNPPVNGTPTSAALKVVLAQNGATPNLPNDWSYSAIDAHADTTDGGYGADSKGILVTTTGPWGGFQPSCAPGNTLDFSQCSKLTVAIDGVAGRQYSMFFHMGNDVAINAPGALFTKTRNGYEVFTVDKSVCMTDATEGDVSGKIYKGAIASKLASGGDVFGIDDWGGF